MFPYSELASGDVTEGNGSTMCEFLVFVQEVLKKESWKVPFKDGRQGKKCFYGFIGRNPHIVSNRTETPLELNRAMVKKDVTDIHC